MIKYCFLNAVVLVFVDLELPEDCRGRWETFVDQTLSETNRKNTIDLVNMHTFLSTLYDSNYTHSETLSVASVVVFPCPDWHWTPAPILRG